jgi:prepilin-type N-terminal cleavage/methylation domain-containing protein
MNSALCPTHCPSASERGFTLVEISIVLVIIGAIFYGVLKSQSILSSSKAKDVVAKINDLRAATVYFKQRFGYLPGDLPAPANYITVVPALVAGTGGNIGDGSIDGAVTVAGIAAIGSKAAQAPWQLYNAGFIGAVDNASPSNYINTSFGPVQLVSSATATGLVPLFVTFNPSARNAILFFNLPCDVALEVDNKIDDGSLTTGFGVGSAACTGTNPLPVYAVPL